MVCHDGSKKGYALEAPYDVIHCKRAFSKVPKSLVMQLKTGGTLIVPVGKGWMKEVKLVKKLDNKGNIETKNLID